MGRFIMQSLNSSYISEAYNKSNEKCCQKQSPHSIVNKYLTNVDNYSNKNQILTVKKQLLRAPFGPLLSARLLTALLNLKHQ